MYEWVQSIRAKNHERQSEQNPGDNRNNLHGILHCLL
jgi:hypothetical protein